MAGDFDEEKRLFYVAMTRSKKYLYLTHVKTRTIRGVRYALSPSPYLEKIKKELLKVEKNTYKKQPGGNNQLELF
jgi:superfamily I DNA/RNA helicase